MKETPINEYYRKSIIKLLSRFCFVEVKPLRFIHPHYGFEFDLTATDSPLTAMSAIIKTCVEHGERSKVDELKKLLGI